MRERESTKARNKTNISEMIDIIPDFLSMFGAERCQALTEKFIESTDENMALTILNALCDYVGDDWRGEYEYSIISQDLIKKLKDVYELGSNLVVIEFITNLLCCLPSIDSQFVTEIIECGLFSCLYQNLELSDSPSRIQIDLCCNTIVLLSNLVYMSETFRHHLFEGRLNESCFETLCKLFDRKELNKNYRFINSSFFFFRNSIKYSLDSDTPYLKIIVVEIDKEFLKCKDDDTLENIFYCYCYLFKRSENFLTSAEIVECMISKLDSDSKSTKYLALQCLSYVTSFNEIKYECLISLIPHIPKLLHYNFDCIKNAAITTTINLLSIFKEEALNRFLDTTIFHQILHCINIQDSSLTKDILQILEKFVRLSYSSQFDYLISEGLLSHVLSQITPSSSYLQIYLTLLYQIFTQAKHLDMISYIVEEFQFNDGDNLLATLQNHPNSTVSEMASVLISFVTENCQENDEICM